MKHFLFVVLGLSGLMLAGCFGSGKSIKQGDAVRVYYTLSTLSGMTIESTAGTSGKQLIVGEPNSFISVIHTALVGMKKGDAKTMTISPKDGYGFLYDANKIQRFPLKALQVSGFNPIVGQTQDLGGIIGIVKAIEGTGDKAQVLIDLNPLQTRSDVSLSFSVEEIL